MIADLNPYPAYKESGLLWLKTVPTHWSVKRMKYVLREVDLRSVDGKEQLLRVSQYTGVTQRFRADGGAEPDTRAKSLQGYKRVLPDEMVINIMLAWNGSLGVSEFTGIVSPAYCVYRFQEDAHPHYFHYLMRSPMFKGIIKAFSTGVVESRLRLYSDDLFRIEAILPPPDEQEAIVRYLNYVTRRIERAIRAKRKLITLLNEQKQTIIHHAVTRGLDPNAPMRNSGIDWIGEIPAHWEVRKLKQGITRITQGWSPQCDSQPSSEVEWGVLKVGCVNGDSFNGGQNKKLPTSFKPDLGLEIKDGDILVSRANTRELLGLAALVENPRPKLILCDKLFRFKPLHGKFDSRFLVYALRVKPSRAQIESSTNGASSSMQNIGQSILRNLLVIVPPVGEQFKIVGHIREKTATLNSAIDRTEREIKLLQEYRTRLITDVVTGQLDIREAAQHLPVEEETQIIADDDVTEDEETDDLVTAEADDE